MKRKPNWLRIAVIATITVLVIAASIALGKSPIGLALGQGVVFNPPVSGPGVDTTYTEVATYVMKVGGTHNLCWINPNVLADGTEDKALQLAYRRIRIEGGPYEISQVLQHSQWKPTAVVREYCNVVEGPKKAGHWAYQARMCRVPWVSDETSCSIWVAAITPSTDPGGAGGVDGRPKGWWIYAYIPAPTGVGVN